MFTVRDHITIQAPIARCFQLSTNVDIVRMELRMTPVDGRTSGCVQAGDTVRWEGMQLGFRNFHKSLISGYDPPHFFQDRMIHGRFRTFEHDHHFQQTTHGVFLSDEVCFTMPFGPLGWLVGQFILVPHIRKLLHRRFHLLKRIAESDEWHQYLKA